MKGEILLNGNNYETANDNVYMNGKEFKITETKNEVILSRYHGKMLVKNIFKKNTFKDLEVLATLQTTLNSALQIHLE